MIPEKPHTEDDLILLGVVMDDRPRVVVLHEFAPLRDVIAGYLREAGMDVVATERPVELKSFGVAVVTPETEDRLRGNDMPRLMLCAEQDGNDVSRLLNGGADDVLRVPFDGEELVARLRAVMRRTDIWRFGSGEQGRIIRGEPFCFCGGRVDPRTMTFKLAGTIHNLTTKDLAVLACLSGREGQVVTFAELLRAGWGVNSLRKSRSLAQYATRIRKMFSTSGMPNPLETVPTIGYRITYEYI